MPSPLCFSVLRGLCRTHGLPTTHPIESALSMIGVPEREALAYRRSARKLDPHGFPTAKCRRIVECTAIPKLVSIFCVYGTLPKSGTEVHEYRPKRTHCRIKRLAQLADHGILALGFLRVDYGLLCGHCVDKPSTSGDGLPNPQWNPRIFSCGFPHPGGAFHRLPLPDFSFR